MNYIISGPGRVGGHLLAGIIESTGQTNVFRTHDPTLNAGDNDLNVTLIIADRRDRFSALMSNAIVRHTGQSTHYPTTKITPFELDPGIFEWDYKLYLDYYTKHDLSRLYAGVFKVYYEDFVNDHSYIKRLLNLPATTVDSVEIRQLLNTPAPYHYEDIITNWQQLKTLYLRIRVGQTP